MNNQVWTLGWLLMCVAACQLKKQESEDASHTKRYVLPSPVTVTSPALTVLPYDSVEYGDYLQGRPVKLEAQDLSQVERLLEKCINAHNQATGQRLQQRALGDPADDSALISLQHYHCQVIAAINKRGEKEVWVNCFCKEPSTWRTRLVRVKDGGNCFFSVKLNLARNTWYELLINGEA